MATIITRAGKGSPLTNAEVDANFNNLNNAKLELAGGTMTGAIAFAAGQTFPGAGEVTLAGAETLTNKTIAFANNTLTGVQPTLVSGTSIKTVNGNNLLGSGNISVTAVPAGSNSQVQFNTFGSLAASTAFTFNTGNNSLAVSGPITSGLVTMSGGSGSRLRSVALGMLTLSSNSTGTSNTGVGYEVLRYNTSGQQNTSVGSEALRDNTTGYRNCAFGDTALKSNTTGGDNSAFGQGACFSITEGIRNTAVGYTALSTTTTGINNTAIGNNAQASSPTASDTITLGDSLITTLRCQVTTITSLSDARDKTNIVDIPAGLSFVQALRPVAFDWNMRDGGKIGVHEFGFVAQELQAAQAQTGITVPNLVYTDNPEKLEASAGTLIPVLVKAIQELKQQFDDYKASHP